jgi:DNA helicase-2/ATP-dependent DNA helicase PcrA
LPALPFETVETKKEMVDLVEKFQEDVRQHRLQEERRLMYVAITRARHHVLLTGSFWAHHQKPRSPSRFLLELEQSTLLGPLPVAPESDTPPERETTSGWVWPGDPLGSRRASVERAKNLVTMKLAEPPCDPTDPELIRLAAEREASKKPELYLRPRVRISASSLETLASDPTRYWESLARPLPHQPHRAALRGTLFHQYVEGRLDAHTSVPFVDIDGEYQGSTRDELSIEQWIEAFEASEFADQKPLAIEAELHMPVGRHIVVCKMDAVFPTASGVHIVDWKTGKAPATDKELAAKALQLGAYRLAWSHWSGLDPAEITASFWFSESSRLVTPKNLVTTKELADLLEVALSPPQ